MKNRCRWNELDDFDLTHKFSISGRTPSELSTVDEITLSARSGFDPETFTLSCDENEGQFNININPFYGCTVNGVQAGDISDGVLPETMEHPSHNNFHAIGDNNGAGHLYQSQFSPEQNGATVIGEGLTCSSDNNWREITGSVPKAICPGYNEEYIFEG